MLVLNQTPTADTYPLDNAAGAHLGPSNFATGLIFNCYNATVTMQLLYLDLQSSQGIRLSPEFDFSPGGQVWPKAIGFKARSKVAGVPAALLAQVYEVADGPLPASPAPISATLSPSGTIGTGVVAPIVALASFPPATPADGQVVALELPSTFDPIGGKTIRWLATYNAGTAMWDVAGVPLYAEVQAQEANALGGYGDLATVGPVITPPRPGDYIPSVGMFVNSINGVGSFMAYQGAGIGAAADADAAESLWNPGGGSGGGGIVRAREKTGLLATALTAKYKGAGGGTTAGSRWIELAPVRIS